MQKIKYIVLTLLLLVPVIGLNAQVVNKDEVPNSTYIIGTHMFTREVNEETGYNGRLTTQLIMLAAKTIPGNTLEDMIIYYKNPRGVWVNAMKAEEVEVANSFNIEYRDKSKVNNIEKLAFEEYGVTIDNNENHKPYLRIADTTNEEIIGWSLYRYDHEARSGDPKNGNCFDGVCVVNNKAYYYVNNILFEESKKLFMYDDDLEEGESRTYIARFIKSEDAGEWSDPITIEYDDIIRNIEKLAFEEYGVTIDSNENHKPYLRIADTTNEEITGWSLYRYDHEARSGDPKNGNCFDGVCVVNNKAYYYVNNILFEESKKLFMYDDDLEEGESRTYIARFFKSEYAGEWSDPITIEYDDIIRNIEKLAFEEYGVTIDSNENHKPYLRIADTTNEEITGWSLYRYDHEARSGDPKNGNCFDGVCVVNNKAYYYVNNILFEESKKLFMYDDDLEEGESRTYIARFFKSEYAGEWSDPITIEYESDIPVPVVGPYTLSSSDVEELKNVSFELKKGLISLDKVDGWELYKRAGNPDYENAPAIIDGKVFYEVNTGLINPNDESKLVISSENGVSTVYTYMNQYAVRYYKLVNGVKEFGPWSDVINVDIIDKVTFETYGIPYGSDENIPYVRIVDTDKDVTGWQLYEYVQDWSEEQEANEPRLKNNTCWNEACIVNHKMYSINNIASFENGRELFLYDNYNVLKDGESKTYIARFYKAHLIDDTKYYDAFGEWSDPITINYDDYIK